MEKPGDGRSVVKNTVFWTWHGCSTHELAATTVPCPRPRQPRFEWAVLIRSNELLKEKKEEEIKEGDMLGCFWEEWEERVGMDLIKIHCIHIENCQRIIPTYS